MNFKTMYEKSSVDHRDRPLVDILLSTYNGEKYLGELMESVLGQTYPHWRMIIRDDGSSDATLQIIQSYQDQYPDFFKMTDRFDHNLGPVKSFGRLLEAAQADYVALCDQDDIWMADKLERLIHAMTAREKKQGSALPLLVHSDLSVCDEHMETIETSFWKYQHLAPESMKDIRCLLVQNFVTGCTVLLNRELVDRALPIPGEALMIDWWLALIAQQSGEIITIHLPLVKYRQHGKNTIGAKQWGVKYLLVKHFGGKESYRTFLHKTILQAGALRDHVQNTRPKDDPVINAYARLNDRSWIQKKMRYLSLGIKKYGRIRQFLTWLWI